MRIEFKVGETLEFNNVSSGSAKHYLIYASLLILTVISLSANAKTKEKPWTVWIAGAS